MAISWGSCEKNFAGARWCQREIAKWSFWPTYVSKRPK